MSEITYKVPAIHCEHCAMSIREEVSEVAGVRRVEVDLASGRVTVSSDQPVDDAAVRAAVAEAGYEVVGQR